jgi:outer membrane protein assembly factor BamB
VRRVFVLLSGLAVVLASGHPWACFHGDPQHSGLSANAVGAPLTCVAAYRAGGQISGSPVVREDGGVLVGARDVKLYCLDPNLADTLWVADLTAYGSNIYYSSPALDDSGNAYITTDRRLVKVDSGGAVLWSWPPNNSLTIRHSPVIGLGQDRKIYFCCYSESLYALSPGGSLVWARSLGRSVNSAPAVGLNGYIMVATTRDSAPWQLWSFKPNGDTAWSYVLDADAEFASPAVGPDSTIYVGANRYLYAVRPNGTLKWRDSLLARIQSCPAVASESTLYVVAGARLYCIGTDSVVRWRRSIGGSNYCSPAVDAEGDVYVGTANGASSTFYCIGPDSTVRDSHVIGDDIWSSPAIGESGRVYVGCMDSSLYLFQGPGLGVAELERRHRLVGTRLLPNPTCGVARIVPFGRYSAKVFDACGALVATASDADRVDLRGVRRGVYLVQVAGSGCPPQKLVLR